MLCDWNSKEVGECTYNEVCVMTFVKNMLRRFLDKCTNIAFVVVINIHHLGFY